LLNRGRVGKDAISGSYRIRISALPTDTNVDASIKPHETRLVVQCGSGNQELVNHNFPISKNISWSPQDCGDVVLEIYVGDIVLKKTYHGYKAFINFLEDFRTGRKVFSSRAFPEQKGLLAGYGIRTITLGYAFSGQNAVLRLARSDPAIVPDRIIGK
jgi:type VI secretion system protein ImpL